MKREEISGAWSLELFELTEKEGSTKAWGLNLQGLPLYAAEGYMSVSINRAAPITKTEDWEPLDDMLFYARRYQLTEEGVMHQVISATDPERIGQSLFRKVTLTGDHLELTNTTPSGGTARLVWKKLR